MSLQFLVKIIVYALETPPQLVGSPTARKAITDLQLAGDLTTSMAISKRHYFASLCNWKLKRYKTDVALRLPQDQITCIDI